MSINDALSTAEAYDVIVVGGGPVGLATAHECAKASKKVLVLERFSLFNFEGSSGDLVRMFRVMYTEKNLTVLAVEAKKLWHKLEQECGCSLILMTGLLNFGDPTYGEDGPEGTLNGPKANMDELRLPYEQLKGGRAIEERYPFKNLPNNFEAFYSPDCGCINVPQVLRVLHALGLHRGVAYQEYARVTHVSCTPDERVTVRAMVGSEGNEKEEVFTGAKVVVACGAYTNDVLQSLGLQLKLKIWEMSYQYYSLSSTKPALFPSMWFQFLGDSGEGQERHSNLFYGFPELPWGPPGVARIALDAPQWEPIESPESRRSTPRAEHVAKVQEFIQKHLEGVNLLPNLMGNCLQTNVEDNNFVLDFVPNTNNRVVLFCAGWAMKFIPLLGKILKELVVAGETDYDIQPFRLDRPDVVRGVETLAESVGAVKYGGSAEPRYWSKDQ